MCNQQTLKVNVVIKEAQFLINSAFFVGMLLCDWFLVCSVKSGIFCISSNEKQPETLLDGSIRTRTCPWTVFPVLRWTCDEFAFGPHGDQQSSWGRAWPRSSPLRAAYCCLFLAEGFLKRCGLEASVWFVVRSQVCM